MELTVIRKYNKPTYSIGELQINNQVFSNTLEDVDRALYSSMPLDTINSIKIKDQTAIPYGTYKITLDIISPKYSNYTKYPWAKDIGGKVPRLLDVPGFSGILIHPGNTNADTSGCILVGINSQPGMVTNSVATFKRLYRILQDAYNKGETIFITIKLQ